MEFHKNMKRKKPLGKRGPWVWSIEIVRGCNLSCWHCTARLFAEINSPLFMSQGTWDAMCRIMNQVTPSTRLELAQSGEPTLHPNLLQFLDRAKSLTPTTQIQVTSNGLNFLQDKITFQEIFKGVGDSP